MVGSDGGGLHRFSVSSAVLTGGVHNEMSLTEQRRIVAKADQLMALLKPSEAQLTAYRQSAGK